MSVWFSKRGNDATAVDLTAGNSIWYGPEFTRRIEFTPPADNPTGIAKTPYDPARGYSDYFLAFAHDFTGDAWPELLVHAGGQLGYAEIDWSQPLAKARFRAITPKTPENDKKYFRYTHGLGAGDVNGDGLLDILTGKRRWAHGIKGDAEPNAPPVLYWFRLTRDGTGGATYEPQRIDDNSGVGTQVTAGDVTGDGKPDVAVANKRGVFIFRQQAGPSPSSR